MSTDAEFSTPQEEFWAGSFGDEYIGRNRSDQLLASNLEFFARALRQAGPVSSCVELGANIGMNLRAIRLLHPGIDARGVEINARAHGELAELLGPDRAHHASLLEWEPPETVDLALIRGVLIHLAPEVLPTAYDRLHAASHRDVLIAEYYNPAPVALPYRGHESRLFKRDFAGEMLDRFPDLRLVDYGFAYRRDPVFPQDDITWFLLRKS